MESSHNLFLLLTLSTLLFFFPASFPHSKCLCDQHTAGLGGGHGWSGNINYDGNHHIVSTGQHAAGIGGASQGNFQGSAEGSFQGSGGIGGASQGNFGGSAGAGGSSHGNIGGSGGIGGSYQRNFGGSSQGNIGGSIGSSAGIGGASQGNIGGSAGIGGSSQGNIGGSTGGSVGIGGSSQENIGGSAGGSTGAGGSSQRNIGGSTGGSAGIGGSSQGSIGGSAGADGASQGSISGSAGGSGGASQGSIGGSAGGSAGTGGASQGSIGGSAGTSGASQGNIQGSAGISGAGASQGSAGTGGAKSAGTSGAAQGNVGGSAGIGGATQGSSGIGGGAQGNVGGSAGIGGATQGSAGIGGGIHGSGAISGDIDMKLKGLFSKVFAFGDSFSAGFDDNVHGQIMGHSPHGHYCIVDFLCQSLGLPPLPSYKNLNSSASSSSSFQHGVNFATPGASALPKDELEHLTKAGKIAASFLNSTAASFFTQINWFHDFLNHVGCKQNNSCSQELDKSLFWLGGMGIDDKARTAGSSYSLQWLKEKSVAHVSSMLHDVLKSGAKHVVVQGLPPLGCLLFEVSFCHHKHLNTMGCAIAVNAATMIHNRILKKTLETFREQYPNVKIVYGDLWQAFLTILQNPSQFNFHSTFKACCGTGGDLNFNPNALCGAQGTTKCSDPSKYMFWDGIHLTAEMNMKLAHLIIKQIGPQLAAGL